MLPEYSEKDHVQQFSRILQHSVKIMVCFFFQIGLHGILKKSPRAWRDGGWRDILGLTVFGFLCILLVVGPLLDTSTFFMAGFSASSPLAVYLAGVPVNCVHGSAVALTMLLFGKPLLDRLRRIQIKYGMMEP